MHEHRQSNSEESTGEKLATAMDNLNKRKLDTSSHKGHHTMVQEEALGGILPSVPGVN
jgi:hypothetical protein